MTAPTRAIALALAIVVMVCAQAVAASPLDDALAGYKYLRVERHGAILVVRFYNPPTNLLTAPMAAEIRDLVHRVDADKETRVVIFTGGVPGYFIQHYDTSEFTKAPPTNNGVLPPPRYAINATDQTYLELEALGKPTIAAINGRAQGGGVELALACDFRIITDPGEIGLAEITLGLLPGAGGTVRLPRLIGMARAKQIIMLGQDIDAETAVRYGIAMKAVPPGQLMSAAMQVARRLAALPPIALAETKKVMNASYTVPFEEALKMEDHSFDVLLRTPQAQHLINRYVGQNQRWNASQEGLPP
jgi:enoyl-CoA hydratase/carnithine racemase